MHKNDSEKNTNRIKSLKSNIYLVSLVLFLSGFVIHIFSCFCFNKYEVYNSTFKSFVENIATIFISVAIGTCLFEWFGFVDYINMRLTEIIISNDFINMLTKDKKYELKKELEKQIFYNNSDYNENSLLSVVQNEIYPLIESYYYKEYITHVNIKLKNDKLHKIIKRRIVICNDSNAPAKINLNYIYKPIFKASSEEEANSMLNLICFTVEEGDNPAKDITNNYNFTTEKLNTNDNYLYEMKLSGEPIEVKGKYITLNIEIETIVNEDDCIYVQRVMLPCQNFTIHYHYDNNLFNVDGDGFGFMTKKHYNKIITQNLEGCYVIRFDGWLLPGDGVSFYNTKKVAS